MRIELGNLEDGRGAFAHSYQPEDLNPDDERIRLTAPVEVSGNVRLSGTELLVDGHLETSVAVECDRCLKQVELPVKTDFSLEYITPGEYESSRTAELTEELLSVSTFDGESLDVDEIVKEQLLLSVPTRALCQEGCKGICPTCGIDRNSGNCDCKDTEGDPRWAALKNLASGDS